MNHQNQNFLLQQMDPVMEAMPEAAVIAEVTNLSVAMRVWGNLGPQGIFDADRKGPVAKLLR